MPCDHNDHYHRLLLRQLPPSCRTALDVGCGTGRFARRLAQRGIEVDAVDRSAEVLRAARAAPAGRVRYLLADVTGMALPTGAARTLGVPAGTVKTWLARGRRALAARLGDEQGAVRRD